MNSVKISSKYQIAIPASVRKALDLNQGDRLLVDIRGHHIVLMREPDDYAQALYGLHADVWSNVDPREYLKHEREEWVG